MGRTLEILCPTHGVLESIPVPFALTGEVPCGATENPAMLHLEIVMDGNVPKIQRLFVVADRV